MKIRTILLGCAIAAAAVPAASATPTPICVEDPTQSRPPLVEICASCPGPITVTVHGNIRKSVFCQLPI